jgi:chitinase
MRARPSSRPRTAPRWRSARSTRARSTRSPWSGTTSRGTARPRCHRRISGSAYGGAASAAGLFDGIDIDWEYPASASGHVGNHYSASDTANYTLLLQKFRTELDAYGASIGKHYLLTAALPSGQDKISLIQTSKIGAYLDYGDVMTYDMHGAWETTGPTNFQDPVHLSSSDPSAVIPPGNEKYTIDTTITAYTSGLSVRVGVRWSCRTRTLTV